MQSRQPLHTSCWMNTVSNSVRMMALVGQTSMQLACLQCLQTSENISHAAPFPVVTGASGTLSMNATWRQFSSSSLPVLSKLSARNAGLLPLSWFHSLQATSQALQPMQTLVSVKKPTASAIVPSSSLEAHEIGRDFGAPVFAGVKVGGDARNPVNNRHAAASPAEITVQEIAEQGGHRRVADVGQARGRPGAG